MDRNTAPHFHIRWITGNESRIDWEAFESHDEAEKIAKRLMTPSEVYAIDEFDHACERCAMFLGERKI